MSSMISFKTNMTGFHVLVISFVNLYSAFTSLQIYLPLVYNPFSADDRLKLELSWYDLHRNVLTDKICFG